VPKRKEKTDHMQNEESWLLSNSIDVVVSDVTPLPCQAAYRVGIPCLCVSNFSWDFVFAEYLAQSGTDAKLRRMMKHIAEDYACADAILRLPGYTPLPAFQKVIDVPMVVRPVRTSAAEVLSPSKFLSAPSFWRCVSHEK
jgi:L-arabinokinase